MDENQIFIFFWMLICKNFLCEKDVWPLPTSNPPYNWGVGVATLIDLLLLTI
jgi:hypothetical protein